MPLLGSIIKSAIDIRSRIPSKKNDYRQQIKQLQKLLTRAQFTSFGKKFNFTAMADHPEMVSEFQRTVPIYDYESIFDVWWYRTLRGERDVCWPGRIKYFALSSGTAQSSSKHIPVTTEQIKAIHKGTLKQILSTKHFDLKPEQYETQILVVGGSTNLNYNGTYYSGDLSGITTGSQPRWFTNFTKPGPDIISLSDWESKLREIVENAPSWNVGFICGVPAWIQIIFERIIKRYNVRTIHDVWPNLAIFVHGGVAIHPYRKSIDTLCGKPLIYIDTYMASEGFLAYQERPNEQQAMKLMTDNMVFFEFVPFNSNNFDAEGNLKPGSKVLTLAEAEENVEYALLISNCAGAWRYLIGDTVKITDLSRSEVIITGRLRHYLSLCGEHLSVDNMNQAIKLAANELGVVSNEYGVTGIRYEGLFAHEWYVGCDRKVDTEAFRAALDKHLKVLNDDYAVERKHALKEVIVHLLPNETFIEFLASKNKLGGQSKFPRVLKGKYLNDWLAFLKNRGTQA